MTFQGSVITEQGITFAIVIVQQHVLNNSQEANRIIIGFRTVFGNFPIVLMAQDNFGTPTYYGRRDIVNFLSNVPLSSIPWQEYTVNI